MSKPRKPPPERPFHFVGKMNDDGEFVTALCGKKIADFARNEMVFYDRAVFEKNMRSGNPCPKCAKRFCR
jgi:hypothetical protein